MPGGVVTWPVYHGFSLGERGSYSVLDTSLRQRANFHYQIRTWQETPSIYNFFDLLTAIAAHGKTNGFGGRKLSRMAGWWAFEHSDEGKGFEGGYKSWVT
jgi:hypothetical protein